MKKAFVLFLSFVLVFSAVPLTLSAEASPLPPADSSEHINNYHDDDGFVFEKSEMKSSADIIGNDKAGTLPSRYSSVEEGRITVPKSQGSYGSCWAFSATSGCEVAMKEKNPSADLSELQLIYYFYNQKYDPLGNCTGDATINADDTVLNQGGNHLFTMWGLASWTNGAPESAMPYTSANCSKILRGEKFEDKYAYSYDISHLKNAYIIPYEQTDESRNNIKKAIMEYGSLGTSYKTDDANFNTSYYTYYTTATGTNHAVSIVGWNDDVPKNYFGSYYSRPAGDGAWLIKNSWGTTWGTDGDSDYTNTGREGYFWLSYYDASVTSFGKVFVFEFDPDNSYKYNYQYDGSCGIHTLGLSSDQMLATIYNVKGLSSDYERIDAFGIGVNSSDASGNAYIYTHNDGKNPTSGTLAATVHFTTEYPGYYTFEIPESSAPVVKKGDNYSIVVDFSRSCSVFVDESYENGSWITFVADSSNDKSYYVSKRTGKSSSLTSSGMTGRLKGFTNEAYPDKTVSFNVGNGFGCPDTIRKFDGYAVQIPEDIPVCSGYEFLGWSLDMFATTADYKPGDYFNIDGSSVLYAVWKVKSATAITLSESSLDMRITPFPQYIAITPTPNDAFCLWEISCSADDCVLVEEIDYNTFSVTAEKYSADPVSVTFTDINSGKSVTLTVNLRKSRADLNNDGKANVADVILLKKILVGKEQRVPEADVDGDGKVSVIDAIMVKWIIVGLIS